jgi:hypothetical protein
LDGAASAPGPARYLSNQIAKAWMAVGDWHLIRWQGYDASYRVRRDRFASLASGAGLDAAMAGQIVRAYEFKCRPDYTRYTDGAGEIRKIFPELERALMDSIRLMTGCASADLPGSMRQYLEFMSGDVSQRGAENALCLNHPGFQPLVRPGVTPDISLRHLMMSVLPLVLAAAGEPSRATAGFEEARRTLAPWVRLPGAATFSSGAWEHLRALVVRAWFAVCH